LQLKNLRIGQKGLLLISLHLICELIFFAVLIKLLFDSNIEQTRQFEAKEVLLRTSQLSLAYDRAAHYLTMWAKGRQEYRDRCLESVVKLKKISGQLEQASAFDPTLKASFAEHKQMLNRIFQDIDYVGSFIRKNGAVDSIEHMTEEMTQLGQLTRGFADWQEEFIARAEHIESESPVKQERLRQTQYVLICAGIFGNLLLTLVLFRFFSTSISRRLSVLEENTVRFGLGKQLHPLVGGDDEIRELDATFHRMAEQIEQSRRRQRALTENTADMIFSVSEKMRLTELNDASARALGSTQDSMLGTDATVLVPEEQVQLLKKEFESARQTNTPTTAEFLFQSVEQGQVETSWTISWSASENSWFCVARDIAVQKRLERLRQEFIAMITHDMRSPLTSILSNLQMLRKGAYGQIEDKSATKIDIMISNCRQLLAFINDLLDVDRLESGIFELEPGETSTAIMFDKATSVVDGAAISKQITIDRGKDSFPVYADEERIVQVLVNLISNAIKFSEPKSSIAMTARMVGTNEIEISVIDQGRGIAAEKLATIFERYRQSGAGDAKGGHGFGLGLYICKRLLHAHESDLKVRSVEGKGSTFYFSLKRENSSKLIETAAT
jgi:PAS domain S-box-containing protein